ADDSNIAAVEATLYEPFVGSVGRRRVLEVPDYGSCHLHRSFTMTALSHPGGQAQDRLTRYLPGTVGGAASGHRFLAPPPRRIGYRKHARKVPSHSTARGHATLHGWRALGGVG